MVILKLEGIPGQYPGHPCEGDLTNGIELSSISWGISTDLSGSAGSFSAGTAKFDRLTFSKALDKATGQLMTHSSTGQYIKSARIYYLRAGGAQGMYVTQKLELENIVVSGYSLNGVGGGTDPSESISFSPSSVRITYQQLTDTGQMGPAVKEGWDIRTSQQI